MPTALAFFSVVLAAAALLLALSTWMRLRPTKDADLPTDVLGLRGEVAALRREAAGALRHLAVVRYDAFEEMGGTLSWSLALLDDGGDGVVLTSIRGRNEARTYAKSVTSWRSDQDLSPEETEAIAHARP
ncbi:DUF4446 family protein [Nocardioides stalactiti]|uniref:DUF4446 family protein n=1 Tax=Nocardioides stalactiti TaxID=2755356 RepID=UPI0016008DAE|nr:DUF4446 family protein [Nocardioides stalactiti]